MKLKRLIEHIPDLEVRGSKDMEVTGLCANSSRVSPGNLFIAKKGRTHDGSRFIPDAVAAGATAVLTDIYDPFLNVTQLIHPHVAEIEAKLAAKYYHDPSHALKMVGITGTSGKTTTSFLIKHLLDKADLLAGLIGTIEWVVGDHHFPGSLTTPDVITNHKLLREMVGAGCKAAVMEATSHGLDQNRLGEIDFDVALFTNLSHEHLDYHCNMEGYRRAKEKLFTRLSEDKWAVFNADDPATFTTRAKRFTYGIQKPADLMAKQVKLSDKGIQFYARFQDEEILCKSPLIGEFNVYNLLAALGVGLCFGLSLGSCASHLTSFKRVPGRLEKVKNGQGLNIFVDFAHKADALENVLITLNRIKQGKLITIFGCGGDRDTEKREKMGRIVCDLSDEAIVTNDNPRSEDPEKIAAQILKGFNVDYPVHLQLDRRKAIRRGIEQMCPGDILLIAGRGHEKEQIFSHQVIPFDDVEVVREICGEKVGA